MEWETRLNKFIENFEHKQDLIGVIVCGSYITGNPSNHSDLDVHLLLNDTCDYRERGNRVVDGLLIEYFANPPKQILSYFNQDLKDKSLMCQTQFATGKILKDLTGKVVELKNIGNNMIEEFYCNSKYEMSELTKYFLWDMLDDLQDAYDNSKADFSFLYYNLLNRMIYSYMKSINRPYNFKTILGNASSEIVRKKYMLKELPHDNIKILIEKCIIEKNIEQQMILYTDLTNEILSLYGGFNINEFTLNSAVEL